MLTMELHPLTQIGLVLIVCTLHFPSLADAQCPDGAISFNNACYSIKSDGCPPYNLWINDQCCLESCVRAGSDGECLSKCCTPRPHNPQTNNVPSNNKNCNQSCGQNQPACCCSNNNNCQTNPCSGQIQPCSNCGTGTSPCGTNLPLNCNNNNCQNQPCCVQTPTCQNANCCSNCATGSGSSSCINAQQCPVGTNSPLNCNNNNCQNPPCSSAINPLCGSGTPCGFSNCATGTATNPPLNGQCQTCSGQTTGCPNSGTGTNGCSGGCGTSSSNQSTCQQNSGGGTNPPLSCNTYNCKNQPGCDQNQTCPEPTYPPILSPTYPPTLPPTYPPTLPPTYPPTLPPTTTTETPGDITRCPPGTIFMNGYCNLLYCPLGTVMSDKNTCIQIVCPEGTVWSGNKCSPLQPTVQNITLYNNIITNSNGSQPDITLNTSNNFVINAPVTINDPVTINESHGDSDDCNNESEKTTSQPPSTSSKPDSCCTVMTPRTCEPRNNRWYCYSRRYKRCGDFCTAPTIYLTPPRVYSSPRHLVMPPLPRQFDCGLYNNCGQAAAMGGYDCSGCGSNVMQRCSSYCSHYSCPSQSCGFYDQQRYCLNYPGSHGCMPEDGCYDNQWCS